MKYHTFKQYYHSKFSYQFKNFVLYLQARFVIYLQVWWHPCSCENA